MPRRGFVPKREVLPDPVYGTTIVTKLINQIMLDGKRGIAQSVCYDAFQMLADKTGKDAMEVFNAAALAGRVLPQARREDHGRAPLRRDHRREQQHRRGCQA